MNAAIQLVNQPAVEVESYEKPYEKPFNNVTVFELSPEQRLRRAMNYITQLETEIRDLREELSRAERSSTNHEVLLRNALVRELELRAEMFKEK
ncbi:MAG: hypothetical protein ACREEM_02810 [Blastocatellia bacterium]